jgi:RNA polymerase sigma-70 factor (ECF subfamily)
MAEQFADLVHPFRAELLAHCYRMTGALSDAEDALQNALVRAWRSFEQFEGRASLRTWLYKITTNACLDLLAARKTRTMPEFVEDDAVDPAWLEPFPQPDAALVNREAVRLAFVIALQVLPPKQRATLILRDVVGMSAEETAATLETSVAAVNSAMQRARSVLDEHPRAKAKPITGKLGELLGKYLALWEAGDASGLVALLRTDATLSMPPLPMWSRGPEAIAEMLRTLVFPLGHAKLLPCTANGAPAFAAYLDGKFAALTVLDIEDDQIVSIQSFLAVDPAKFGVPATLPRIELVPGGELGRYRLEHVLGSGGMGTVWRAHDRDLDRDVALKVLRAELADDGQARTRLLREARAMAKLRHPNVLTVYDVTSLAGNDVLVMELVDGMTLTKWARTHDAHDALVAAGRGLAAAHAAGIVHRDFKPDNVLVAHDGRVLVGDFGLASGVGDRVSYPALDSAGATAIETPRRHVVETSDTLAAGSPLTQPGMVMGTPAYMSPEQRRGEPADARADQYAFCVAAVELLGERDIFMRGLAASPDDRWPSMDALLDALGA